jgi:hypothetical protein
VLLAVGSAIKIWHITYVGVAPAAHADHRAVVQQQQRMRRASSNGTDAARQLWWDAQLAMLVHSPWEGPPVICQSHNVLAAAGDHIYNAL